MSFPSRRCEADFTPLLSRSLIPSILFKHVVHLLISVYMYHLAYQHIIIITGNENPPQKVCHQNYDHENGRAVTNF